MKIADKIIVLDRDGVINIDSDDYIKSLEEWIPIPGSIKAIATLYQLGYKIFIATNQSGIGRGYYDLATLNSMHDRLESLVSDLGGEIAGIVYCPHIPADQCTCRKPKVGMLDQIQKKFHVDLKGHPFVGDSLKDLEVAESFGCEGILVKTGKGMQTLAAESKLVTKTNVFNDLEHFVSDLITKTD